MTLAPPMPRASSLLVVALLIAAGSARAEEPAVPDAPADDAPTTPASVAAPAASSADTVPAAAPTHAPAASGLGLLLGADLAFQGPLGELADRTGMGFGALVRAEYKLIRNLNVTFRTGYVHALWKDTNGIKTRSANIPVWVGGKVTFMNLIYAGVEVGLNRLMGKEEIRLLGITVSNSSGENKFGGNLGAGVLLGNFDIRAQFQLLSFRDAGKYMAVMVNAGYNFAKL